MKLYYKPIKFQVETNKYGSVKTVGACYRSPIVVTKDNDVHFLNKLVQKFDAENETTGVKTVKNQIF